LLQLSVPLLELSLQIHVTLLLLLNLQSQFLGCLLIEDLFLLIAIPQLLLTPLQVFNQLLNHLLFLRPIFKLDPQQPVLLLELSIGLVVRVRLLLLHLLQLHAGLFRIHSSLLEL